MSATNKALYIGCEFGTSGVSAILGSLCSSPPTQAVQLFSA